MKLLLLSNILAFLALPEATFSFLVIPNEVATRNSLTFTERKSMRFQTEQKMMPLTDLVTDSASTFISTISADIDNIPDNEFGKIFAGGIVVMFGGVFSALIVGFLLESGNSYAGIVADSYAQGGDEEFWESLSPEDQKKTRELLKKLNNEESSGNTDDAGMLLETIKETIDIAGVKTKNKTPTSSVSPSTKTQKEEVSMFADYDD